MDTETEWDTILSDHQGGLWVEVQKCLIGDTEYYRWIHRDSGGSIVDHGQPCTDMDSVMGYALGTIDTKEIG